jgi:uncharacterized protein Smg (DUF494 family)
MTGDLVEILEKLVQAINNDYSFEEVELFINFEDKVNKTVIAAAYSWIYEKLLREYYQKKELKSDPSKSVRILSEEEISAIGLHNYDYILHFYNIGLINNNEFDMIIDQIKLFPEESRSIENLNMLILSVFLDLDDISTPGSRYLLYSSDTIN